MCLAPGIIGDAGSAWDETRLHLSFCRVWDSHPEIPRNAKVLNPAYRQLPGSFLGHTCFFWSRKNWALQAWSWTEWHKNFSWNMLKETMNCQLILPLIRSGDAYIREGQLCAQHPCHGVQEFLRGCHYRAGTTVLCIRVSIPLPMLPPSFPFLSEEVLYLRYHKYSRCIYSPCNLGYYPWAHPSGELGTGISWRDGEEKKNALFFKG